MVGGDIGGDRMVVNRICLVFNGLLAETLGLLSLRIGRIGRVLHCPALKACFPRPEPKVTTPMTPAFTEATGVY